MNANNGIVRYRLPPFPISSIVRAGDFLFTSALADHEFDPADVCYDEHGNVTDDGSGVGERTVEAETEGVIRSLCDALAEAGATLADVIELTVWLKDPRDFAAVNGVCARFFVDHPPVRSVFQVGFMFDCRVEIKATAYKPLRGE